MSPSTGPATTPCRRRRRSPAPADEIGGALAGVPWLERWPVCVHTAPTFADGRYVLGDHTGSLSIAGPASPVTLVATRPAGAPPDGLRVDARRARAARRPRRRPPRRPRPRRRLPRTPVAPPGALNTRHHRGRIPHLEDRVLWLDGGGRCRRGHRDGGGQQLVLRRHGGSVQLRVEDGQDVGRHVPDAHGVRTAVPANPGAPCRYCRSHDGVRGARDGAGAGRRRAASRGGAGGRRLVVAGRSLASGGERGAARGRSSTGAPGAGRPDR